MTRNLYPLHEIKNLKHLLYLNFNVNMGYTTGHENITTTST